MDEDTHYLPDAMAMSCATLNSTIFKVGFLQALVLCAKKTLEVGVRIILF